MRLRSATLNNTGEIAPGTEQKAVSYTHLCGKRFTTYEKVETIPLIVIKKDNTREQYDRSKIEGGVLRACHKRPISVNQINQLVDEVETEIFNRCLLYTSLEIKQSMRPGFFFLFERQ